jgi:starch-binding outer membrane protein, SusD/RagB family
MANTTDAATWLRRVPAACATGGALLATLTVSGCGDIFSLKQENKGQLTADAAYTPANAQLLVNGVIADFECAYVRYVTGSALLGDELINAFANTSSYDYDRRTLNLTSPYALGCGGAQLPGIYTSLSTARGTADVAYQQLSGWTDAQVQNRTRLMATVAAYAGYSLLLLGEGFCSGAIDVGPELTPAQLFAEALVRFDRAIADATNADDATMLNLARLGRARALLNTGQPAEAATAAGLIPSTFVVNTSMDASNVRRQNLIFVHLFQSLWSSVDPSFRDLTLNGAPDPRVVVVNSDRTGPGTNVVVWQTTKYPAITTPVPVARYAEAQLIIAEARASAGDLAGAAAAINAARNSGRTDMPQYDAAGQTATQVRDQIIEERRREFFLEGRRFWDVRRFDLPLVPAPGEPYLTTGTYGDQRCFPLPAVERNNNPNFS